MSLLNKGALGSIVAAVKSKRVGQNLDEARIGSDAERVKTAGIDPNSLNKVGMDATDLVAKIKQEEEQTSKA